MLLIFPLWSRSSQGIYPWKIKRRCSIQPACVFEKNTVWRVDSWLVGIFQINADVLQGIRSEVTVSEGIWGAAGVFPAPFE